MADSVSVYKSKMNEFVGNPSAIQRVALAQLESALNGEVDIVDPSNPFVFLLETATVLASASIEANTANNRKQYPTVAVSEEDIYLHMSDVDYIDRFSKPGMAKFWILLSLDEIKAKVKPTEVTNVSKLVIPRHTHITVGDVQFTMQYPIEIRKMAHGGLQIVYDTSKVSPLQSLESNIVDWNVTRIEGIDYVLMSIPIYQFTIKEYTSSLNIATGFSKNYVLTDNFYYCRAYIGSAADGWDEILTTHSDQVFNPAKPTVLLKVVENTINVEMPIIYFTSGQLVNKSIRIDIYTTKGPIELILNNYIPNTFLAVWEDLENDDDGEFFANMSTFRNLSIWSSDTVVGGVAPIDFNTLRDRVVNNAVGAPATPITSSQLETTLANAGFSVVKNLDNITDRQFLATRELPSATIALKDTTDTSLLSDMTTSPIATAIRTIEVNINDLVNLDTVEDNGNRVTILPKTLYEDLNGIINIVPSSRIDEIYSYTKENQIDAINSNKFSYTPFHYVLDINNDNFDLRPYYLDNPVAIAKTFIAEEDRLAIEVSIGRYSITKVDAGYRVVLVTKSGDSFKALDFNDVYIQASFKPKLSSASCYLDGVRILPADYVTKGIFNVADGERVFEFILETKHDVDADDCIYFNNFQMYDASPRIVASTLDMELTFTIIATNLVNPNSNSVITGIADWMIVGQAFGIVQEKIKIQLGVSLHDLWANCRSVLESIEYQTYVTDELKVHSGNVYQMLPGGLKRMEIIGGVPTFFRMYKVGDPVFGTLYTLDKTLTFKGTWNAATNVIDSSDIAIDGDPMMVADVSTEGWYFTVSDAGTTTVGANSLWAVGDAIISVGGVWQKDRQQLEHEVGDIVHDVDGNPIPINTRRILRQIDICLFDGLYYFATDTINVNYRNQIPVIISSWLNNEIANTEKRLLERSQLFFYPKTTFGNVKVIINDGSVINIFSDHSFNIKLYVSADVFNNSKLKNAIAKTCIETIAEALSKSTVSITNIQMNIKIKLGDLIKGVDISNFGDDGDITTFTVTDDTVRGSIKKRVLLRSDSTISVQDYVDFEWIKHEL